MGLKPRSSSSRPKPKTAPTNVDPRTFIGDLADSRRRREAMTLLEMMERVTGESAVMWGPSIVGFGTYHYRYSSGREGDWPRAGFSPRKSAVTIYCMMGFSKLGDLLARLGPHSTAVSCLYIKRLDAVDLDVLSTIVKRSYDNTTDFEL